MPAVAPWQTETWSCLRLLLDGDAAGANSVDAGAGARRLDHHGVLAGVQVVHQDIETFSPELRSETVTTRDHVRDALSPPRSPLMDNVDARQNA